MVPHYTESTRTNKAAMFRTKPQAQAAADLCEQLGFGAHKVIDSVVPGAAYYVQSGNVLLKSFD